MAAFGADVLGLSFQPLPLLLALWLVRLLRGPAQLALVVLDLWLFMELLITLVDPGYRFGDHMLARLFASAVQIALAGAALHLWRHWRRRTESVTVH